MKTIISVIHHAIERSSYSQHNKTSPFVIPKLTYLLYCVPESRKCVYEQDTREAGNFFQITKKLQTKQRKRAPNRPHKVTERAFDYLLE